MFLRVPSSTYRVQFNPDFNFKDAERLVPYLSRLGIGDLYASPALSARAGSQHGYDVADASRVSRDLGGEKGFRSLSNSLREHDMGLLLDIVPNHMAASTDNPWWSDLLENGRRSRYANYFDIDWHSTTDKGTLRDKVLLPVLGQVYGAALEAGEIQLHITEAGFVVRYYELQLPLSTRSYARVLEGLPEPDATAEDFELRRELAARVAERTVENDDKANTGEIFSILWRLYTTSPTMNRAIDDRLREINGRKGDPSSFTILDSILDEQAYRLAYWRRASDEINYRRFFDISDLVGVRVEEEEVFQERHALILRMIKEGLVTGVRIDHVDGLYHPVQYLSKLQRVASEASSATAAGDVKEAGFYVAVEKILVGKEQLPEAFVTAGTTGYDYLNALNNLFVDRKGLQLLDDFYEQFTGVTQTFEEIAYERKKQVLEDLFWGEVRRLGDQLIQLAITDRYARDIPARQLSRALVEVTARLPVYRTYIDGSVSDADRNYIQQAVQRARSTQFLSQSAVDFVERILLLQGHTPEEKKAWTDFVLRWQQFTGRVMAKGVEDTAFYVFNRLISMNDVGGGADPRDFSLVG